MEFPPEEEYCRRVTEPLRVAIAGGGIGGLTAGIALRKAGASPTVF